MSPHNIHRLVAERDRIEAAKGYCQTVQKGNIAAAWHEKPVRDALGTVTVAETLQPSSTPVHCKPNEREAQHRALEAQVAAAKQALQARQLALKQQLQTDKLTYQQARTSRTRVGGQGGCVCSSQLSARNIVAWGGANHTCASPITTSDASTGHAPGPPPPCPADALLLLGPRFTTQELNQMGLALATSTF